MDKRVIKTRQAIQSAFITLMKERPLDKITVQEITRQAEIGRGTFYLHYKDVNDLYQHIAQEAMASIEGVLDADYTQGIPNLDFVSLCQQIIEKVLENKDIYQGIIKSDTDSYYINNVKKFFIKKICELEGFDETSVDHYVEVVFYISGIVGLIESWLRDDLPNFTAHDISAGIDLQLKNSVFLRASQKNQDNK
ncbi:TetR/AcrR family transcriptional regulator [Eupransor demetentiae]|uniref:AcrR family n=1 Tax=Eupransor demetentiae TaxID=3109584 RepID=A0ABM9N401_9LACO|nr:AcrR family [Lactobacillaceae bacterium LMG 33000]